jgi:hypothetical protein
MLHEQLPFLPLFSTIADPLPSHHRIVFHVVVHAQVYIKNENGGGTQVFLTGAHRRREFVRDGSVCLVAGQFFTLGSREI